MATATDNGLALAFPSQETEREQTNMTLVQLANYIDGLYELRDNSADQEGYNTVQQELERAVHEQLARKTDGIKWFKIQQEGTAATLRKAKKEFCRDIDEAIARCEKRWEEVRAMTRAVMIRMNKPVLKGDYSRISLTPGKEKLNITDATAVPDTYRVVTMRMPAELWHELNAIMPISTCAGVTTNVSIDEDAVCAALKAKQTVPGAELKRGDSYITVT